jgi:hypothetical protein
MVLGMELRSEERKAARGWQTMTVVGYVWCCSTYVRSSEGSAGDRANGVGDILLSEGIRESDAWSFGIVGGVDILGFWSDSI